MGVRLPPQALRSKPQRLRRASRRGREHEKLCSDLCSSCCPNATFQDPVRPKICFRKMALVVLDN